MCIGLLGNVGQCPYVHFEECVVLLISSPEGGPARHWKPLNPEPKPQTVRPRGIFKRAATLTFVTNLLRLRPMWNRGLLLGPQYNDTARDLDAAPQTLNPDYDFDSSPMQFLLQAIFCAPAP